MGLEEDEARAYLQLLRIGPSKVRRLAEAAELERSKTYRILDELEAKGFVEPSLERPTRYRALEPSEVFDDILEEQRDRIEHLRSKRDTLLGPLERLERGDERGGLGMPAFRTIQGRDTIYRNVDQLLEETEEEVLAMSTHPAAVQLGDISGIMEAVIERVEEGIGFRTILNDEPRIRKQLDSRPSLDSVETRLFTTERTIRFLLRDETELIVMAVSDPSEHLRSEQDVAVLTDAHGLVQAYLELFDRTWAVAEPP